MYRYRDKERTRPTTPPAPSSLSGRATTPLEKKPTINVTVNPKSLVNPAIVPKAGIPKPTNKKIDMGAASSYGVRTDLGINSPTHRNTHAEEDLFTTDDAPVSAIAVLANQTDLLDDIFKTCATVPTNNKSQGDDDFFNPREDESQEFGDFASAFGNNSAATPVAVNNVKPAASIAADRDEFADFSSAFVPPAPALNISTNSLNNSNSLLFGANNINQPLFNQSEPSSLVGTSTPVTDLLSDLDGLSLGASVPSGKFTLSL